MMEDYIFLGIILAAGLAFIPADIARKKEVILSNIC